MRCGLVHEGKEFKEGVVLAGDERRWVDGVEGFPGICHMLFWGDGES